MRGRRFIGNREKVSIGLREMKIAAHEERSIVVYDVLIGSNSTSREVTARKQHTKLKTFNVKTIEVR